MGARERLNVGELVFKGIRTKVGTPVVNVLARDAAGKVLLCSGSTVPSAGDAGYAAGCMFLNTANGRFFTNNGSATSAAFITPSHRVVFSGLSTAENDANAEVVVTLTGALATDIAIATIHSATNAVYVTRAVVTENTLTVTLSGNGGVNTVVNYVVLRAVS